MNRRLNTTITDIRRYIILTKEEHKHFWTKCIIKKEIEKGYKNNKYTKEIEYLEPGHEVFIRDLDNTGEIEKREMNERSYGISTNK